MRDLLPEDVARVLGAEPLGLPLGELARRVRRRWGDVLGVLVSDARFEHHGGGRGSRWRAAEERPLPASRAKMGKEDTGVPYLDASGVPLVARAAEAAP